MRYSIKIATLFLFIMTFALQAFSIEKKCSAKDGTGAKSETELNTKFQELLNATAQHKTTKAKKNHLQNFNYKINCDLELTAELDEKSKLRWRLVEIDTTLTTLLSTPCSKMKAQIEFNDSQGAQSEVTELSDLAKISLKVAEQLCPNEPSN